MTPPTAEVRLIAINTGHGGTVNPIVVAGPNWLLGASSDAGWLDAPAAAGLLTGGERYQVAGASPATGAKPERNQDICTDTFTVQLSPASNAEQTIAVAGATWALTPRQPVVFSQYYEGASAAAYVIRDTTAEQVLATGCGA
jgi:hypothetical protein